MGRLCFLFAPWGGILWISSCRRDWRKDDLHFEQEFEASSSIPGGFKSQADPECRNHRYLENSKYEKHVCSATNAGQGGFSLLQYQFEKLLPWHRLLDFYHTGIKKNISAVVFLKCPKRAKVPYVLDSSQQKQLTG